ncbi:S1C family serine protease [Streptomyces sp. C8S0]|nr:trypsin-like peptidase domain-containing protein [Streptomyces sp. C8S0]
MTDHHRRHDGLPRYGNDDAPDRYAGFDDPVHPLPTVYGQPEPRQHAYGRHAYGQPPYVPSADRQQAAGEPTHPQPAYGQPAHAVYAAGPGDHGDGSGAPAGPPLPPVPPAVPRRRAKRPVALVAAVALAAAAVGGGAGALAQRLAAGEPVVAGGAATGTGIAQSSKGTVAGVAQAVSPSIVEIKAATGSGQSTGSGVIITADGEIVTNNHVISGASEIRVQLSDGSTYTADVLGTAPDKDLALIKLRGAQDLKPAVLGDSSRVRVGEQVVAIGSPEGLTGTVTSGIVSALDRDVTVAKDDGGDDGQRSYDPRRGWPFEFGGQQFNGDTGSSTTTYKALQTDASLNPGNSGGALIDMNGEVIGINSAMYAPSGAGGSTAGSIGLGFAIPIDTVKADLDELRSGG